MRFDMRELESCNTLMNQVKQKGTCIIWGTKLASKLAFDVCKELNIEVKAFGDNSPHQENDKLEGLPIISAEQLRDEGSIAVIIGSFFNRIEREIRIQLSKVNNKIIFVPYTIISYYHEILFTNRKIDCADEYFKVLQNVWIDESKPWQWQANHNVLWRYCYKVNDTEFDDLLSQLDKINGITELFLVVNSRKLTENMLHAIREKLSQDKIGHLILITDGNVLPQEEVLLQIKKLFYYVSVDHDVEKSFCEALIKHGIALELTEYNQGLFKEETMYDKTITEDLIYRTICEYTGRKPVKKYNDINQVIIVQLFNGLANQMLMYLFGHFLEMHTGKKVIFDDTVLMIDIAFADENVKRIQKWNPKASVEGVRNIVAETRKKNSFYHFKRAELAEVFPIDIRLLSDYFEDETWRGYLTKAKNEFCPVYPQAFPLGQLLLKKGVDLLLVQDSSMPEGIIDIGHQIRVAVNAVELPFGEKSVTNFFINYNKNVYFLGVWATGIDRDWLNYNRKYVWDTFRFQIELDGQNQIYYDNIVNSDAVIIHIRRSDFINMGWAMDEDYVKQSVLKIDELPQYSNLQYFIFSDDLEWCEKTLEDFFRKSLGIAPYFVRGNEGKNSYIDLYLMSMGKIYVPSAVSSFSYLAMLMSEKLEWYVDVQKYLYYKKACNKIEIDLCCFEE